MRIDRDRKPPLREKPRVFIASSAESLEQANALAANLEHSFETTVWTDNVFAPSRTSLESLLEVLGSHDFGVFLMLPDDVTTIRTTRHGVVRDNVILELGLWIGRLGRERVYAIVPNGDNKLRLPTDLLGFTPLTFDPNRSDKNWNAALRPAATKLAEAAASLGMKVRANPTISQLGRRIELDRNAWMNHLSTATRTFVSFAMASWHYCEHPDFETTINDGLNQTKCVYSFYLLNPDSSAARQREREEARGENPLRQRIRTSLKKLSTLWGRMPKRFQKRLRIVLYDWYPTYSFVQSDDSMYLSLYLYQETGDQAPTFILQQDHHERQFSAYLGNVAALERDGLARALNARAVDPRSRGRGAGPTAHVRPKSALT